MYIKIVNGVTTFKNTLPQEVGVNQHLKKSEGERYYGRFKTIVRRKLQG